MIVSAIFFGIKNFSKSPFSNKAIIDFFENEITTKYSSYSRVIKSMKKLKSRNDINISFFGMNNEVSISYQAVEYSELLNNHEENELKKSNELEFEKVKSISNYLNLSYIGKVHFDNNFYYEFYNTTANHPGHNKKIFLIYFPDKLTQEKYIKRSGIDTYSSSKSEKEWIVELDSNWIIQSQQRDK